MRFYVVPIIINDTKRYPKYIKSKHNSEGLDISNWGFMPYGFEPYGILFFEGSKKVQEILINYPDVYTFPENLDSLIATKEDCEYIKQFFEGINIPMNWVNIATSYRAILRRIGASCQILQRLQGMLGNYSPFSLGGIWGDYTLNTKISEVPLAIKGALLSACGQIGIKQLNESTTIRGLINRYAWEWSEPIIMGGISI